MKNKIFKTLISSTSLLALSPFILVSCYKNNKFDPKNFQGAELDIKADLKANMSKITPSEFVKNGYLKSFVVLKNNKLTDEYLYEIEDVKPDDAWGYVYVTYSLAKKTEPKTKSFLKFKYIEGFKNKFTDSIDKIKENLYFSKLSNANKSDFVITSIYDDDLLINYKKIDMQALKEVVIKDKKVSLDFGKNYEGIKQGYVFVSLALSLSKHAKESSKDYLIELTHPLKYKIDGFAGLNNVDLNKFLDIDTFKAAVSDNKVAKDIKANPGYYIRFKNADNMELEDIKIEFNNPTDKKIKAKFKLATSIFNNNNKQKVVSDNVYEYEFNWND
ncbi:MAG1050 family protein [Mycoplasmopsis primatum]|uniref:MAG1050 family protein n=1 Tax=Mycoplasmopsis primatum TaxID=55604 RepID=UPI0004954413|nr:hypothetical protein [Mycoplasmopsis primatum]